jgi:HTH-type transcriptional regulator/antitoxin HigA
MSEKRGHFTPDWISPPGDTIADILDERDWTQQEFAKRIGYTTKHISQLINGKVSITQDTAMRLERVLGSSAGFWLTREAQYREAEARLIATKNLESWVPWAMRMPFKELMNTGFITKRRTSASTILDIVNDLLGFFGVASPDDWEKQYAAKEVSFRRTKTDQSDIGAISAWLRMGEIASEKVDGPKFNPAKFEKALSEIRSFTTMPPEEFDPLMKKLCRDSGVVLVYIPSIPGAHVSGAARWLNLHKPIIQLSLYGKMNDRFWFTFFHEAAHILKHGKDAVFLDELEGPRLDSEEEQEADQWASNILIPAAAQEKLRHLNSKKSVQELARDISIHPGIVVGRMQHEHIIPYKNMNGLKEHFEFSNT